MSHFTLWQTFEEVVDIVIVPVVKSGVQDIQCYFVDEYAEYSFVDEDPFLITQGGEYENIQPVYQYEEVLPHSQANTSQYVNAWTVYSIVKMNQCSTYEVILVD